MQRVEVSLKECPICQDKTVNRKIVGSCRHSVCYSCIGLWLTHIQEPTFLCPVCRSECVRPKEGMEGLLDDIPDEVKTDELPSRVVQGDEEVNHGRSRIDSGIGGDMGALTEGKKQDDSTFDRLVKEDDELLKLMTDREAIEHQRYLEMLKSLSTEAQGSKTIIEFQLASGNPNVSKEAKKVTSVTKRRVTKNGDDFCNGIRGDMCVQQATKLENYEETDPTNIPPMSDLNVGEMCLECTLKAYKASLTRAQTAVDNKRKDMEQTRINLKTAHMIQAAAVDPKIMPVEIGVGETKVLEAVKTSSFENGVDGTKVLVAAKTEIGEGALGFCARDDVSCRNETTLQGAKPKVRKQGGNGKPVIKQSADHVSSRVKRLTEEWKKDSAEKKANAEAIAKKSDKIDFVVNEKDTLCIRYWEKVSEDVDEDGFTRLEVTSMKPVVRETENGEQIVKLNDPTTYTDTCRPKENQNSSSKEERDAASSLRCQRQDEDDLSDVDSDPGFSLNWCRQCLKFDRTTPVNYSCPRMECAGLFCSNCAWQHNHDDTKHAMTQDCSVHEQVTKKAIQCANCEALANHVKPLTKNKVKILGAKGWRIDRYNSTETCDRKLKHLQDKQVIQFCKKKFNLDDSQRVRMCDQEEMNRIREREREEALRRREEEELHIERERNREIMLVRDHEEEIRLCECDREIDEQDKQLKQAKLSLQGIEDKRGALMKRKDAILAEKEGFIRELKENAMEVEAEIDAHLGDDLVLGNILKDILEDAKVLVMDKKALIPEILDRVLSTKEKLRGPKSSDEDFAEFCKRMITRTVQETEDVRERFETTFARFESWVDDDDFFN